MSNLAIGTYAASMLGASYRGTLTGVTVLAEQHNTSWITATADGRFLYAVTETAEGSVTAYARDPGTSAVTPLNTVSSGGAEPAHLEIDPSGRFVAVANYGAGSVSVFAREPDGRLGEMTCHVQHTGASGHPDRQTSPHPHQILFDPVTGDLLVPDLGIDAVLVYRLGPGGALTERVDARIAGAPGAGPRHAAFHPGGQHLFLVNELDSTLTVLRRDGDRFVATETVPTVPDTYAGDNYPSAVRVSGSGRSVLVANRGHDSIAVFGVDLFGVAAGTVALRFTEPVRGLGPRDIVFTPDGGHLLVANTGSDTVAVFAFAEEPATLAFVAAAGVESPACLRLLP